MEHISKLIKNGKAPKLIEVKLANDIQCMPSNISCHFFLKEMSHMELYVFINKYVMHTSI